jgi:hypothetical protein
MSGLKLINIIKENKVSSLDELDLRTFLNTVKGDSNALKGVNGALHGAIDDVLKFAANDKNQIVGLTAKSPNKVVKLTNVDDFLHAIRTPKGIDDAVLGLFNQGLLKSSKTPAELIDGITKEVVKTTNFKNRYAKLTDSEMKKALKSAGYSDGAVDSFMKNAKKDANFKKAFTKAKLKRTAGGKNKNMSPKGNGSNVPAGQKKTLRERASEIINMVKIKKMSWKQLVPWAAGIGITALALWWFLYDSDEVIPEDTPETEPEDTTEWAPCIKELLNSGEGTIMQVGPTNLTVVRVVTPEYPEGLNFVSNGRVADVKTKKMGTWKCKDGQVKIQKESKKTSLIGLLNEQDDALTAADVEIMIDLLDFPVKGSDLVKAGNLLQKYVNNGKGKYFLGLYKKSGYDNNDLTTTLKYIKTTEASSVQAKDRLVKLNSQILSGKVNEVKIQAESKIMSLTRLVLNEQGGKIGLSKIDIKWDGEAGTPPKAGGTGGGVNYHDCSSKDFPFEFGCISPKIAEIQGCLGITPQKGYFGPKTKRTMEPTYDLSSGITKTMYEEIKAKCGGAEAEEAPKRERYTDAELAPIATPKISTIDTSSKLGDLTGKVKPIDMSSRSSINGESLYKMLQSNYGDGTKPEFPYIFAEGGRLKYKGDTIGAEAKDKLSQYVETLGYREEPIKDKDKSYGVKYVWVKQ